MKYLTFFLLVIVLPLKADEINEEIIFQEKSFSQNNIISSIKSEEILLKLINSTENNNNFFYSLFLNKSILISKVTTIPILISSNPIAIWGKGNTI